MGKWLERKSNWLNNDRKREPETESEVDQEAVDSAAVGVKDPYGVDYIPLRCPRCRSKGIKTYASKPPVRYHKCRNCGWKFKSTEKDL
jgi:hypothetical protein